MARLEINSNGKKSNYKLGNFTTIGRLSENRIQILDELVSKHHAVIFKKDEKYFLKDLGSKNGSYINKNRVIGTQAINDTDIVTIGKTLMKYTVNRLSSRDTQKVQIDKITPNTTLLKQKMTETGRFRPVDGRADLDLLRTDYEKLRILFSFYDRLVNIFDQKTMFETVLEFLSNNFQVERAAILEKIEESWSITIFKSINENQVQPDAFSISSSVLEEVEEKENAVLSFDASIDSRFSRAQSIIMQGVKSVIALPVIIR